MAADGASPVWRGALAVLGRLPQASLSRAFGALADIHIPRPARAPVYRLFARAVGARLDEVELPLRAYASLDDFFVRRLKPGARSWVGGVGAVHAPVDGVTGAYGRIREGRLVQAKGIHYDVAELLDDAPAARAFEGGAFLTMYLAPRHYHRIHSPVGGAVVAARHMPGSLFPVNPPAVASVPRLFARNERLVTHLDGPAGPAAVVAVGAFNVGRITTAFDDDWQTNRRGAGPVSRRYDPPLPVAPGDELMAFHLGSTVVLLLGPDYRLDAPGAAAELQVGAVVGATAAT